MPVRLVRKVTFSSGHRYWLPSLSPDENRRRFGCWASPYNHGHNYILEAGFEGEIDPETGMVINIKVLDELLDKEIVAQFDQKSVNDEVEHFRDRPASLENLLLYVRDALAERKEGVYDLRFTIYEGEGTKGQRYAGTRGPRDEGRAEASRAALGGPPIPVHDRKSQIANRKSTVSLVSLRLVEMPELWAEWTYEREQDKMTLTRTYEFAASHRLCSPSLSQERNLELYGKCANPSGHGHNYKLEVSVAGEVDTETGMMVDLMALDAAVNRLVVDRYDHHHLNEDLPEFEGKVTTSEVVASEIWRALDGQIPAKLERVRLFETDRSWFEIVSPI